MPAVATLSSQGGNPLLSGGQNVTVGGVSWPSGAS